MNERAVTLLQQSLATARRLGATVWVRQGEAALRALSGTHPAATPAGPAPSPRTASLSRSGGIWTVAFAGEEGNLPHVKGLADIATLVRHPGRELPALQLVGGAPAAALAGGADELIDVAALNAYRRHLDDLTAEIELSESNADLASLARLTG